MTDKNEGRGQRPSGERSGEHSPIPSFIELEEEEATKISAPPSTLEAGWASMPPKVRDRAVFTVVAGGQVGAMYTLGAVTVVGRGRGSAIRIDDPMISREHARVFRRSSASYVIEDLKSRNGTFVNGTPIQYHELVEGDRVSFGSPTALRFGLTDEQEEVFLRRLYESSVLDGLTGAFNRKHFSDRLVGEIAYAKRHKVPLSLLMFDLDHFKKINDTLGHLAGDRVLKAVSTLVKRTLRTEDVFARYGGEEFVIIARGTDLERAFLFAERIRTVITLARIEYDGRAVPITISTGVASLACCPEGGSLEEMVSLADKRLYHAKASGRNRTIGAV